MYCRKCGRQILDDSLFCQYCGEKVQFAEESLAEETLIEQTLVLTEEEAKKGAQKEITIDGVKTPLRISVPARIGNGEYMRLPRVKVTNSYGKKTRKDIYIKFEIKK